MADNDLRAEMALLEARVAVLEAEVLPPPPEPEPVVQPSADEPANGPVTYTFQPVSEVPA